MRSNQPIITNNKNSLAVEIWRSFNIGLLVALMMAGLFSPVAVFSAPVEKIQQLKNLYIDTDLVTKGNTERLDRGKSSVNVILEADQSLFAGIEDGLLRKYDME